MSQVFREPFNGFSHLVAALLAIAGLCILTINATLYGNAWHITSFAIFGFTMFLLFTASSLYHLIPASEAGIQALKKFDHIAIFLLIAGTYTPFCLVPLRGVWGWTLFGLVWAFAIAGILMKLFWIHAPRWFSTLIYLGMGWLALPMVTILGDQIGEGAIRWLAYGGICYTIGAVVYAAKWPDIWPKHFGFHGIWHLFVMGGAFCHFWAVAYHLV